MRPHHQYGAAHIHHQMKQPHPALSHMQSDCEQFLGKPQFAHSLFLKHWAEIRRAYPQYLAG